jgi:lysophospholipase L1-like esterase
MRARRSLLSAAVAIATVAASALTVVAGTASAATNSTYRNYVALGDSYTSGPLIPIQRLEATGCFRSTENYPSILASNLNLSSFTDVSCSGAATTNMTASQDLPILGSNPPQFDALRFNTDLVTVGIGGNDFNFMGDLVGTCPGLRASDPVGNPCERHFTVNGLDTKREAANNIKNNVLAVLKGIHARSPQAKVLVIGYPRIIPTSGTCPDILPFSDGDYPWLAKTEETLNKAIADAVTSDGKSSYVDTYGPSKGHDACAANGAAWINGQKRLLLTAAEYHPFKAEMEAVASIVRGKL